MSTDVAAVEDVSTPQAIMVGPGISLLPLLALVPISQPFRDAAISLGDQAQRATIDSVAAFQKGTEFLSVCDTQLKRSEEERKKAKVPADEYGKMIQSMFVPSQDVIKDAKALVSKKMLAFQKAEENRQREEADRIRRQQEEEALRLAEEQAAKGNIAVADAIVEMAAEAPPAKAPSAVPVGSNSFGRTTHTSSTWVGEVAEPMMVLRGILDGKIPISVLEFKQIELNKIAKLVATEGTFLGVKITKQESLRQR